MPCTRVGNAIVCTRRERPKKCGCGRTSTALCDWKVEGGTCDARLCYRCTYQPAPGKDLCPTHASEWKARLARSAA